MSEKTKENEPVEDKDSLIKRLLAKQEATEKELEKANKKLKYAPKEVPIPDNQKGLPEGMQDSSMKTTVTNFKTIIEEKMIQLHDLATMEVLMDTSVRMRKRLESIKKMGSAEHIKVRGQWKTVAPQIHISKLEGKKINNDEYQISFGVFDTDKNGNKILYTHYADFTNNQGETFKRPTSAEYRIAYEIVETIKTGKPITREVIKVERITQ